METINAKLPDDKRAKLIEIVEREFAKNFGEFREAGAAVKLKGFELSMFLEIAIETEGDGDEEIFKVVVN